MIPKSLDRFAKKKSHWPVSLVSSCTALLRSNRASLLPKGVPALPAGPDEDDAADPEPERRAVRAVLVVIYGVSSRDLTIRWRWVERGRVEENEGRAHCGVLPPVYTDRTKLV